VTTHSSRSILRYNTVIRGQKYGDWYRSEEDREETRGEKRRGGERRREKRRGEEKCIEIGKDRSVERE
jgi:hypothetical protein